MATSNDPSQQQIIEFLNLKLAARGYPVFGDPENYPPAPPERIGAPQF